MQTIEDLQKEIEDLKEEKATLKNILEDQKKHSISFMMFRNIKKHIKLIDAVLGVMNVRIKLLDGSIRPKYSSKQKTLNNIL